MAMEFEAKHRECVRVLTYTDEGHFQVKLFVFSGKSGISETLKAAAQDCFKMKVKLEWLDLYMDVDEILKIRTLKYSSSTRKALNDSEVNEMNKIITENLHVLVRHRNITAVQPSFKIKNSEQTETPCITLYVLCKGVIPYGECLFPLTLGSYPVDVVDGIWFRTDGVWKPNEAQVLSEVLCWGASIGVQGKDAAGTLGAIVKGGDNFYVLSCDHVMRHGTVSEIIHPAQNDHLNYLNYHLKEYKSSIKHVFEMKGNNVQEDQFSFDHILELKDFEKEFQELQRIKKTKQDEVWVTMKRLEGVEECERDFERGLTTPRVIATYSVGISGNMDWSDDKQYYVDAALAKLTLKEVRSLRESKEAKMIDTTERPSAQCNPRLKTNKKLCKSGRTTGFTKSDHHSTSDMFLFAPLNESNAQNEDLVSVLNRVRLCESCKGSDAHCDSCEKDAASLCLKNCLCIETPFKFGCDKVFATEGDSGAVLFERDEHGISQAFGIIFAEHRNSFRHLALATPMKIALQKLGEISGDTTFELLIDYGSKMKLKLM